MPKHCGDNYLVASRMSEEDRLELVRIINTNRISDVLEVVMLACDRRRKYGPKGEEG